MLETNILYRQTNNLASQINYEIPFNQIEVGGIIGQGLHLLSHSDACKVISMKSI